MNFMETTPPEADGTGWHADAVAMLKVAADPDGTRQRLDELRSATLDLQAAEARAAEADRKLAEAEAAARRSCEARGGFRRADQGHGSGHSASADDDVRAGEQANKARADELDEREKVVRAGEGRIENCRVTMRQWLAALEGA